MLQFFTLVRMGVVRTIEAFNLYDARVFATLLYGGSYEEWELKSRC